MKIFLILLLVALNASAATTGSGYSQKEDYAGCNGIVDKDKKAYCQAMDANNADLCSRIGNSDLQNRCLAKTNNDVKYCKRISDDKKKKTCEQYIR
jgi:hypothetical protein